MTVIYLEDLLAEKNFAKAVNGLSRRVRDAHDFPPVHQIGFVVPDVERAAEELEDLGIGPFFIIAGRAAYWREKGELRDPRLKLGMAYHQDIQIELLEPVVGSDIHANSLHPSGKPVVEHLAFLVKDVDAWAEKLVAAGTDLFVRATLKGIVLTAAGESVSPFMRVDADLKTRYDSVLSPYPQEGTGTVFVIVGARDGGPDGATLELIDATGKAFYVDENGNWVLGLTATTSAGTGGFVEVGPGEVEVEIGGTASNCLIEYAWPSDSANTIRLPVREGFMTVARVNCD